MDFKFPKSERLTSEKEISALFLESKKFVSFPFKVHWIENQKEKHQILISCPKKKMKKAVDRNLIKRRMREAFRLNKNLLYDQNELNTTYFNIAFVYIGNEILDSDVIHSKLKKAIDNLIEYWNKNE